VSVWRRPAFGLALGVVAAAGLVPFFTRSATLREEMFLLLMYAALASSLNIFLGYTGYVNFGHIVFFGLGGYVGFFLLSRCAWPLGFAALAGGLSAMILAALVGAAALRLRGAYFALATIGVNEAVHALINNWALFGGSTGMAINFSAYRTYGGAANALWLVYGAMLVVTLAVVGASYAIKSSRFGLGLLAIREDEDAAQVMGVPAPRAKVWALVLSALAPGIVGVLFFFKNGNIEPGDAFRLNMSIEAIVMVMLGGQGLVLGPVIGAAAYERLRSYLLTQPLFKDLHLAIAGLLLLLIALFVPAGLIGWLRTRFPRWRGVLE
jgi:branched-chain amino acid transport system permease protein